MDDNLMHGDSTPRGGPNWRIENEFTVFTRHQVAHRLECMRLCLQEVLKHPVPAAESLDAARVAYMRATVALADAHRRDYPSAANSAS